MTSLVPGGQDPLGADPEAPPAGPPDPAAVAEEARWLAEPAVAMVATVAWRGGPPRGLLVSAAGADDAHDALVREWLRDVEASRTLRVPDALRAAVGSLRVLAVPMRTPGWTVGALALPLRAGWGPIARELEALGTDFALRFEWADRVAQRALLRHAWLGRRPAGARTWIASGPRIAARALGASGAPRLRPAWPAWSADTRRAEPPEVSPAAQGRVAWHRRHSGE